jgi:catechol 2,3-dioxygenase-like lactoylglutathione lyase family enzyme
MVGLHHVQLAMPAGREEDAVSFYEGLLGIPRVEQPKNLEVRGGCWFDADSTRIGEPWVRSASFCGLTAPYAMR